MRPTAREWVLVRADVLTANLVQSKGRSSTQRAVATYRYTFEGKDYTGTRLSIATMGGADNIGDWQEEIADFLQSARNEKRQVNVFVNPALPSQAVVDRAIRWNLMLFLVPFALGFGGVGAGALAAAWFVATRPEEGSPRALARAEAKRRKAQQPGSGVGILWVFALLWSALAFPIAGLAMPQIIRQGNWVGYFVLLFPLVGLLLLWAAASATWGAIRARSPGALPGGQGTAAKPQASARTVFATDRPASFFDAQGAPQSFAPEVAIPPETAAIEEHGNRITIRYPGGMLAALLGRLTVVAGEGQLQVDRNGLFGRKEFRVSSSSVTGIAPALSYTVMSGPQQKRYYALQATTRDGQRIPLGNGIRGEEIADAIALRIAKALKLAPAHVRRAGENVKT